MMKQRQVSNSILCSSIYIVLSARRRRRARQHNSRSVEMQRLAPPRRAPADTQRKRANAFDEQRAEQARRSPTRAGRRWRRRRRRARAPVARRSTDANNARRHGACRPARRSPTRQSNALVSTSHAPTEQVARQRAPASVGGRGGASVRRSGRPDATTSPPPPRRPPAALTGAPTPAHQHSAEKARRTSASPTRTNIADGDDDARGAQRATIFLTRHNRRARTLASRPPTQPKSSATTHNHRRLIYAPIGVIDSSLR